MQLWYKELLFPYVQIAITRVALPYAVCEFGCKTSPDYTGKLLDLSWKILALGNILSMVPLTQSPLYLCKSSGVFENLSEFFFEPCSKAGKKEEKRNIIQSCLGLMRLLWNRLIPLGFASPFPPAPKKKLKGKKKKTNVASNECKNYTCGVQSLSQIQ